MRALARIMACDYRFEFKVQDAWTWYYGQYYNWRFSMAGLDFEKWLQQLEEYHQKYSKKQEDDET